MESAKKSAVVIYHKNCVDGFGAAWAFHTLKERDYGDVEYVAAQYGDSIPPRIEFTDVYILDFSYSREILHNICKYANKVVVLDHHKTAQETLENWKDKPENLEIEFDMNRSGAGITWDYFSIPNNRPALIDYIEDRDLWRFKLHASKEISAFIRNQKTTFSYYDSAARSLLTNLNDSAQIGYELLQQESRYHESIINECTRKIVIAGETGLVCNCPGFFASEVGNLLASKSGTFGATYYHDSTDSVRFSLRSIGDFDVSRLAKIFGGGGHKNAAGFTLTDPNIDPDEGILLWTSGIVSKGIDPVKT
jgi:oligoribonuclease NrnB/cAMP/cGMP phosphodiesterase (DHH superfamily)